MQSGELASAIDRKNGMKCSIILITGKELNGILEKSLLNTITGAIAIQIKMNDGNIVIVRNEDIKNISFND